MFELEKLQISGLGHSSFKIKEEKTIYIDPYQINEKDKADIIRLFFQMNPSHEGLLLQNIGVLEDLIEGYCLAPLRRIYAESYREG